MSNPTLDKISIVLPAKNEASSLELLLPALGVEFPDAEIIVVNDGSTDNTRDICEKAGVIVCNHPYSKGNGAAIKSGARTATRDYILFMDADGQHSPKEARKLVEAMGDQYDMVVGARSRQAQASLGRLLGNGAYNRLSSWIVGRKISDLTSGFRLVNKQKFLEFINLLPNGFSYPTTITMAFFKAGYSVRYLPVEVGQREGNSHINIWKDGSRFFLIIFKVGTLYSPLKIFTPISALFFSLGIANYIKTYIESQAFTNMSALLLISSVLVFLIGLVSEQITTLVYQHKDQ